MIMKIKVFKIGGNVVENPELLSRFSTDFSGIEGPKILVHGGGVRASALQKQLGQTPNMIEGRRVTDADTLEVVTMVYAGLCNKNVVARLQSCGCDAIGLCGADANLITATRRPATPVDYGFVGDIAVSGVRADMLLKLLECGLTPVLCAINHDGHGQLLNTNADTVASSIAQALSSLAEVELVYCFGKNGVLSNKDDDNSVIPHITPSLFASLKTEGVVADGMIPKLENSFKAIKAGVKSVVIKSAANLSNNTQTVLTDD